MDVSSLDDDACAVRPMTPVGAKDLPSSIGVRTLDGVDSSIESESINRCKSFAPTSSPTLTTRGDNAIAIMAAIHEIIEARNPTATLPWRPTRHNAAPRL